MAMFGREKQRDPRNFIATYDDSAPVEYQMRAIAFFDILGWRQAVEESDADPNIRKILLNAVWSFAARAKDYVETETEDHPSRDEYSQFSDSVIVSFPYAGHYDLYRLLKFVTEFQTSMVMLGLPLRGGVTVGPLFHMDAIAFGPAMNRAYCLESQVARMPRIIIDRSLDDDVVAAASELPKHWSFVVRGDDGYYETDFLAPYVMNEKLAKRLEVKIDNWIQQYRNDDGILAKYQWLKARWDASKAEALERIKKGFNYQGPHNAKGGPHMD